MLDDQAVEKLETRLQKEFREEAQALYARITRENETWRTGKYRLDWEKVYAELQRDQQEKVAFMEKQEEENRRATLKQITGYDLAIKRLDRAVELLTKEVAQLKKDALTGADLKALEARLKKLESAK